MFYIIYFYIYIIVPECPDVVFVLGAKSSIYFSLCLNWVLDSLCLSIVGLSFIY